MEQNKPEYKELFCVFGVRSQAFSCLILATGRNKGKLDGGSRCVFVEGDAHVKGGFVYTSQVHN